MSILDRATKNQSARALSHAKDLMEGLTDALNLLGKYERANEAKGPLQRTHSANCIAHAPCLEQIGIKQIEVDPDGNIVQVERINKDNEAEEGGEE